MSANTEHKLLPSLQKLGLNRSEAIVFCSLLKLGQVRAGEVVSDTGLHRQLVYNALENLTRRDLVFTVSKGGVKLFAATSPDTLVKETEERHTLAIELLPALNQLRSQSADPLEVRTLYGNQSLYQNIIDAVDSAARTDRVIRIIGGAHSYDAYDRLEGRYEEYVEYLKQKKVKKYLIAPAGTAEYYRSRFMSEHGNKMKTLSHGLSSPTLTRITKDMVSIELYATETVVVQIRNKAIAKSYLESFELLWRE
jgi:sugar-specific transcriptional regulator TrmB